MFLILGLLALLIFTRKVDRVVVIEPTSTLQEISTIIVNTPMPTPEPTFTPFYVMPTEVVPVHIRSTAETGQIGTHETGRNDHRSP